MSEPLPVTEIWRDNRDDAQHLGPAVIGTPNSRRAQSSSDSGRRFGRPKARLSESVAQAPSGVGQQAACAHIGGNT
jgi:hypothetical protein